MKKLISVFLLLSSMLNIHAQTAEEYYLKGNSRLSIKDYNGAIENYSNAIKLSPMDKEAYYNCGIAYARLGKYNESIVYFDKVILLDSLYYQAYFNKGYVKYELGDFQECVDNCNKAIAINSKFCAAYSYRGIAKYRLNYNVDEALLDCNSAIDFSCDSFHLKFCYYNRGSIKQYSNDFKGAITDYSQAIKLDTAFNVLAYFFRADCKEKIGEYQSSIEDYNLIINAFPKLCMAYINRGNVKLKLKDKSNACLDFSKAIELGCDKEDDKLNKLIRKNCGRQRGK